MQCPVDGTQLTMSDRQGIEIDYCPKCRGVWLDRGEIDKIVERSTMQGAPQNYPQSQPQQNFDDRRDRRDHDDDDDDHHYNNGGNHGYDQHNQKKHKRESWFGELFE
jgi:Zn-finger nucleic acid-binding protein